MTYHFCTYFDHNYLARGLALYRSLEANCPDFMLWVLPMSPQAEKTLKRLKLPHMELIRLADFEDPELLAVKPDRTAVEYMWTLTPSLPLYILRTRPDLSMITYLDADLLFFSSPEPIFTELGDNSILLIEHRYSADRKEWEKTSGRFNVQLMTFRRDERGLAALRWWRERCIEWCFHRYEDGKLGDQMYLNDWPTRFPGVHILRHKGAGLAPWNIRNYTLTGQGESVFVDDQPLVFYHFHAFRLYSLNAYEASSGYQFTTAQRRLIYTPYLAALREAHDEVRRIDPAFHAGFSDRPRVGSRLLGAISWLAKRWR